MTLPHVLQNAARRGNPKAQRSGDVPDGSWLSFPSRQLEGLRTTAQRVRTDRPGDRIGRTTRQLEDTAGRASKRWRLIGKPVRRGDLVRALGLILRGPFSCRGARHPADVRMP